MSTDPAADPFQLYPCPAGCGREFPTVNGAVMHAVNSEDQQHAEIVTKAGATEKLIDLERERCRP
jgi:hypothetical protein